MIIYLVLINVIYNFILVINDEIIDDGRKSNKSTEIK